MSPLSNNHNYTPTRHRQFRPPFHAPHHNLNQNRNWNRLFGVKLFSNKYHHHHHGGGRTLSVESIVSECNPKPCKIHLGSSGTLVACIFFQLQTDAVDAFVWFWERRLAGDHYFTLVVDFRVGEDVNERIKSLFKLYGVKVLESELVGKLEWKVNDLSLEIQKSSALLKKPKAIRAFTEIEAKKRRLLDEMDGIVKRVDEFKSGVKCVLDYLEGKEVVGFDVLGFKNEKGFNWSKIHSLLLRECRRLEDGLPIYGFRREILQQIYLQQVLLV